jgi:hypothetical protein
MASVQAGSRLVLHGPAGPVPLRVLRETAVDCLAGDAWSIPVLAPVSALAAPTGVIEVSTPTGLAQLDVHLSLLDGTLALRPGPAGGAILLQRREDVREAVRLPLRAAAVDAVGRGVLADAVVAGATTTISAGGISAEVDTDLGVSPSGTRMFVELELPGPLVVPAVVAIVDQDGCLRGRFVDIAPIDRERLVRLVFAAQRRELAERRRRMDSRATHLPR